MSKHTPGPWHIDDASYGQIVCSRTSDVAVVRNTGGLPHHGNARLIAAAPELLEALRDALAAMEHMGDVMNGMDIVTDEDEAHFPAFAKARAAIAKAEGTS